MPTFIHVMNLNSFWSLKFSRVFYNLKWTNYTAFKLLVVTVLISATQKTYLIFCFFSIDLIFQYQQHPYALLENVTKSSLLWFPAL